MSKKVLKVVAIVLAVCILIAAAFLIGMKTANTTETTTTQSTTETTTQPTTETTTQPTTQPISEATTQSATQSVFADIKLCLYYKANGKFITEDITSYLAESVEKASVIYPTGLEVLMDDEKAYIEPEIRIYGISKEATVTVVYESEATKADDFKADYNDGVTQFYYWETEIYDSSEEGIYSFKIIIEEENSIDKVAYFKIGLK